MVMEAVRAAAGFSVYVAYPHTGEDATWIDFFVGLGFLFVMGAFFWWCWLMDGRPAGQRWSLREVVYFCTTAACFGVLFATVLAWLFLAVALIYGVYLVLTLPVNVLERYRNHYLWEARMDAISAIPRHVQESWQRRGWLVMMRARQQGREDPPIPLRTAIVRVITVDWPARFRHLFHTRIWPVAANRVVDTEADASDIELQEMGGHGSALSRAVSAAVEIEEEDVFRCIVMYL